MERNCTDICKQCFPESMSVDEFTIKLTSSLEAFKMNMKMLNRTKAYAEEWMKTFAAWMEMQ